MVWIWVNAWREIRSTTKLCDSTSFIGSPYPWYSAFSFTCVNLLMENVAQSVKIVTKYESLDRFTLYSFTNMVQSGANRKLRDSSHQLGYTKRWGRYCFFFFFFHFSKQFLSYHKEGVKCWPGWNFICLVDECVSEVSQGWRFLWISIPTDQVLCKSIRISDSHCALRTHMLTNAKSV